MIPITARELRIAAIAAASALVLGFVVEHVRDRGRDDELEQLRGAVARDASTRVAAVAHTDTAIAHGDTAVRSSAQADSGWSKARAVAARVPTVLAAPVPDTVKIRELVATVDTLRIAGDSLERAVVADTVAIVQLRGAIAGERNAWSTERGDLARALEVSEARHRHWGLGITIGPAVVRDPAGIVRAGPIGATIGVTYRW